VAVQDASVAPSRRREMLRIVTSSYLCAAPLRLGS
jgi:hypothetical protein